MLTHWESQDPNKSQCDGQPWFRGTCVQDSIPRSVNSSACWDAHTQRAGTLRAAAGVSNHHSAPEHARVAIASLFNDGFQRWSHFLNGHMYKRTAQAQTLTPPGGNARALVGISGAAKACSHEAGAPLRQPGSPLSSLGGGVSSDTLMTWRRHCPGRNPGAQKPSAASPSPRAAFSLVLSLLPTQEVPG